VQLEPLPSDAPLAHRVVQGHLDTTLSRHGALDAKVERASNLEVCNPTLGRC
jgi:hypothetical protein